MKNDYRILILQVIFDPLNVEFKAALCPYALHK